MAVKNVYLNDDENNELHPYINAANILDPDNLTKDCATKKDTLNVHAGYIKNGANLNEVTDMGIFLGNGVDGHTLKNLPPTVANDSNLWFKLVNIDGAGLTQIYIQGSYVLVRSNIGNPPTWDVWKAVNYTAVETVQAQVSFLAQQLGGN